MVEVLNLDQFVCKSAKLVATGLDHVKRSLGESVSLGVCRQLQTQTEQRLSISPTSCRTRQRKPPDESGANAMVLVAPVEGFPLKPGEQLPHGVQHVGHGGHNRGENHLGNKSLRWIPGVRQES